MKNKINFDDLSKKKKEIVTSVERIDDKNDIYKATIIVDNKDEIVLNNIPGQFVKEDHREPVKGEKKLTVKQQLVLAEKRVDSILSQLQQLIFSFDFYGGKLEGHISEKNNENGKK